jgi:hypothetical protein
MSESIILPPSSNRRILSGKIVFRDAQILQTSRSHLKILSARIVTGRNFHTEYPQIFGVTVQNLVAQGFLRQGFLRQGFVHPW